MAREFVRQRIAPLQRHTRPMWALSGPGHPMRLQVTPLTHDTLQEVLGLLTGGDPGALPLGERRLNVYLIEKAFAEKMPRFDEWGLPPESCEGPCDNPVLVAPVLADPGACAPEVTVEEPAPSSAPGAAEVKRAPSCAPEGGTPSPVGGAEEAPPVDAASTPAAKGSASYFGIPLPDVGGWRKRKRPGNSRGDAPRALRQRKWIVVDE